jgi:hypothetical protein
MQGINERSQAIASVTIFRSSPNSIEKLSQNLLGEEPVLGKDQPINNRKEPVFQSGTGKTPGKIG